MMPKSKITSSGAREIESLLDQKRTPEATAKHLLWISKHLELPLWQVRVIANRKGIIYK